MRRSCCALWQPSTAPVSIRWPKRLSRPARRARACCGRRLRRACGQGSPRQSHGRAIVLGSEGFLKEQGIDAAPLAYAAMTCGRAEPAPSSRPRRQGRWHVRHFRSGEGVHTLCACRPSGAGDYDGDADRRQRSHGAIGRPPAADRLGRGLDPVRPEERRGQPRQKPGLGWSPSPVRPNQAPALTAADFGDRNGHRHRCGYGKRRHHTLRGRSGRHRPCPGSVAGGERCGFRSQLALYPFFGILLSPVIAAAAMALSSVSVIGNALRPKSAALD